MIQEYSNFVIHELKQTQVTINHMALYGIDILYTTTIHEAAYDSAARDPPHRCSSGTRDEDIARILSWAFPSANNSSESSPLHWTRGAPGAGKSALAQTCVESLKDHDIPFVSFFFSRSQKWNDHRKFFPTIAYQLSTQLPDYRAVLDTKILYDKSLLYHKTLASQFKGLILDPLRELDRIGKGIKQRIPVFIDALDECDSISAQSQIIEIISAAAISDPHIFSWAFFTRPEPLIEMAFSRSLSSTLCCGMILNPPLHSFPKVEIVKVPAAPCNDFTMPENSSHPTQPMPEVPRAALSLFCRLFSRKEPRRP